MINEPWLGEVITGITMDQDDFLGICLENGGSLHFADRIWDRHSVLIRMIGCSVAGATQRDTGLHITIPLANGDCLVLLCPAPPTYHPPGPTLTRGEDGGWRPINL